MRYVLTGIVIIALILSGYFFWQAHTAPTTVKGKSAFTFGDYAYRCSDGTEFTMSPASDMTSILITPVSNVERISQTILSKVEGTTTAAYEGDGLSFVAHGETVQLSMSTFTTTCNPVVSQTEAPFNFGD